MGDYISTSFSGDDAVTVFASAKAKKGSVFSESMYAASIPVTAAQAYPLKVHDAAVLSRRSDRAPGSRLVVTP